MQTISPLDIVVDIVMDEQGRYIFLKGTLHGRKLTLANIYCPNAVQVPFMQQIGDRLTMFKEGITILRGDINAPLNPLLDTFNGASSLPFRALRRLKTKLASLELHDAWRFMHPTEKYYTFYSASHHRYFRIDYLYLSQSDLTSIREAYIAPMTLSDHHPVTVTLYLQD